MFFVLSKIVAYVVMPFTVVCILLATALFIKKQTLKKKLFVISLSLLFFFSNDFIENEVMMLWEVPVTPFKDLKKNYEWGILLTGVTKYDTGPLDRIYFACGADRVTHTVQLYKTGRIKKILVSGGSGRLDAPERKEAFEVEAALKLMGVPQEDIITESESRNTHESAVAVKKMLVDQAIPSECILITSGYHLRRSAACFRKERWNMDCFSVDFRSHKRKYSFDILLIPKVEVLSNWNTLIKEWTGMIAYKAAGYI
ncbi:MAG: YdcF family protein [Bacteroidetes bacterium]|nr:YdcF family protein [Bacteroidota bacterium]